ncbi:hypothetical protein QY96_03520 [Bacillus thermotolerans]|uniref:Uncharacterized protein n=1 Tax=Bacillus thermotolerans TaxID=1221996 RepID=A0A0F5I3U4_BACTR|nr:hypothetical protein QY95_01732 [Bacillus thermotolerans]KKB44194.1 hypothetical protein QY96_03520 [Bacillus thermotolerans]
MKWAPQAVDLDPAAQKAERSQAGPLAETAEQAASLPMRFYNYHHFPCGVAQIEYNSLHP